ncbi:hypothetical protein [Thermocatellispora tengchongensis]|uniref:hypothetical protein n=1 Tax=Thermocatellispora tengchongensis TaxID=1073253 RepID=UPI0036279C58
MRFARNALAAAGLAVAVLNGAGPALAATAPTPVPSPAKPSEEAPHPVPEGLRRPAAAAAKAFSCRSAGSLLAAGAGTGLLVLRRRKHARV